MNGIATDRRSLLMTAPLVAGLATELGSSHVGATSPASKWEAIRSEFDLNPDYPQLSTVVSGLVPRPVRDEMFRLMDQSNSFRAAPGSNALPGGRAALRERVRVRAANLVGAQSDCIAFTRNTTEGIATVLNNLPMQEGDEVIVSRHEHAPYYGLLERRTRTHGVRLRFADIPTPANSPQEITEAFAQAITQRTRLMMVTHVSITGQVFPVKDICALAREKGIPTLVDGALALAHVPVDVSMMQCDYYACNFHKWACGPHGTGLFYVRQGLIEEMESLHGSAEYGNDGAPISHMRLGNMEKFSSFGRHPDYHFDALDRLFDWHDSIGASEREKRLRDLTGSWTQQASAIRGFRTAGAAALTASLTAWEIEGKSTLDLVDFLWSQHGLVLGVTDALPGLFNDMKPRHMILTNTAVFTNRPDLDRLLNAIEDAARKLA